MTFVELCQDLPDFSGEWTFEPIPNLILWGGVSLEGAAALDELQHEDKAYFVNYGTSTLLCYLADGAVMRLPQAKQLRAYSAPHWLPVTLHKGHPPAAMHEIGEGVRVGRSSRAAARTSAVKKERSRPRPTPKHKSLARYADISKEAMQQRAASRRSQGAT